MFFAAIVLTGNKVPKAGNSGADQRLNKLQRLRAPKQLKQLSLKSMGDRWIRHVPVNKIQMHVFLITLEMKKKCPVF